MPPKSITKNRRELPKPSQEKRRKPENPLQEMKRELMEEYTRDQEAKQAQQRKAMERLALQDAVDRLREDIEAEQQEKDRLRGVAKSLRTRIETVKAVCSALDKQKTHYESFTEHSHAARSLRSPEMLAPDGLLTFSRMEGDASVRAPSRTPQPNGPKQASAASDAVANGRSAKRTAYCTDYGNQRYLGVREADAKEALGRRIALIVDERVAAAAAEGAQDGGGVTGAGAADVDEFRGLAKYGYHGADSRINLSDFQKRSSRRTRMYRDYEGKFVKMDPADWPSTQGVLF